MALVSQVSDVVGLELELISPIDIRTGSGYLVIADGQKMLLKAISINVSDNDSKYRLESLMKEAEILQQAPDFTNYSYIGSGELNQSFWLLRKWINGESVWDYTSYIRSNPLSKKNKIRFIRDLSKMLGKIIQFYHLGYLHGDLQPRHFIVDELGKYHLIDLETAINVNDPSSIYRGALVHYVSPEVAQGMLESKKTIQIDQISEIYSFGAVAFFLYTGELPVSYGESMSYQGFDFPFAEQLKAIIDGRVRSFGNVKATPFPKLERILQKCLAKNREQRYQSFEDLYNELNDIC